MLAELRREADRRLRELSATGGERRRLREAAEAVRALEVPIRPIPAPLPEPVVRGAPGRPRAGRDPASAPRSIVPRIGMPATIVSLADNGDAELNVRGLRVRVKAAELADARLRQPQGSAGDVAAGCAADPDARGRARRSPRRPSSTCAGCGGTRRWRRWTAT